MITLAMIGLLTNSVPARAAEGESTDRVGGKGGGEFIDVPDPQRAVVGFEVTVDDLGASRIIKSVQAIFETPQGRVMGQPFGNPSKENLRMEAKPEYAVGAIEARGGDRVDGFRAIFMRRKGTQLDPTDQYRSRWIGGRGGSADIKLGGDGRLVIGVQVSVNEPTSGFFLQSAERAVLAAAFEGVTGFLLAGFQDFLRMPRGRAVGQ